MFVTMYENEYSILIKEIEQSFQIIQQKQEITENTIIHMLEIMKDYSPSPQNSLITPQKSL